MMKKLLVFLTAITLGLVSAQARPAYRGTHHVTQPDGSTLTIRLVGDEYRSYNTTDDGYSLVKNSDGYYVYAQLSNGRLVPTTLVAHNADARTPAEHAYLTSVGKGLTPDMSSEMLLMKQNDRAQRARSLSARKAANYDYSKFRGLVLLVEFNDCPFTYDDYADIMTHMINDDNYTGDSRTNVTMYGKRYTCTGSMRDYFRDNSNGIFVPTFDVVGPVKINRSQYYPRPNGDDSNNNYRQLMVDACTAADELVNFKDYDVDNDGVVDMIYFIFSGISSYISGNDGRLLWPHQSDLSYYGVYRKDGVKLSRYACSTELFGTTTTNVLEGIGTLCHEFSHVLGLMDFYDTNAMDTRSAPNPAEWSVMANGADNDYGRTPCGYSLYERYALGFATPQLLSNSGTHYLTAINFANSGFRINVPQRKEYFLLENRQPNKWDAKLPGHGMLVFRVDSTYADAWNYNIVNDNPDHLYYELLRAGGQQKIGTDYVGAATDPFPGTKRVTKLDNETSPANLLSWSGRRSPIGIRNIQETSGVITFESFNAEELQSVTLPSAMTLAIESAVQLVPTRSPEYAPYHFVWTSDNDEVATVSSDGVVTGVAPGVAHITLTANDVLTAVCEVTVLDVLQASCIAAFRAFDEGTEAMLTLKDAEVLHVKSKDVYVRDASGSIIFNVSALSTTKNDRLNGIVYGRLALRNGMPVFESVTGMTSADGIVVTAGSEVQPRRLHISQLSEADYGDMVLVEKAQLERNNGVYAVHGDKRIRLYNTLSITSPKIVVPTDYSTRYDIMAIYGTNTLNGELIDEFYLLQSPTAVDYTELTAIELPATLRMEVGRTMQLVPTLTPSNADIFAVWESTGDDVVSVDQDGNIAALADGMATITVTNLENGLQAQCVVTVGERQTMPDIASFRALPAGSEADLTLTDAQVVYVDSKTNNVYLRDASGSIVVVGSKLAVSQNDVLNGKVFGRFVYNNLMPTLQPIGDMSPEVTAGTQVEPHELTMSELTDRYLADYVVVKATQLKRDGGIFAYYDDHMARLYNTFGITSPRINVPTNFTNKYYDVTAIYLTNTLNGDVIYELALLKSPEEVANPNGIVAIEDLNQRGSGTVYNLSGQRVTEGYRGVVVCEGRKHVVK